MKFIGEGYRACKFKFFQKDFTWSHAIAWMVARFFPCVSMQGSICKTRYLYLLGIRTLKNLKNKLLYTCFNIHSSQFEGLCSTKRSSKTVQNLPYFWHDKTHIVFFRLSFHATLFFSLMNALVYVNIVSHSFLRTGIGKWFQAISRQHFNF